MTEYQGEWNRARPDIEPAGRDERMAGVGYAPVERITRASADVHLSAPEQRALDLVELASMDSFPCSDPPGHGHA